MKNAYEKPVVLLKSLGLAEKIAERCWATVNTDPHLDYYFDANGAAQGFFRVHVSSTTGCGEGGVGGAVYTIWEYYSDNAAATTDLPTLTAALGPNFQGGSTTQIPTSGVEGQSM